MASPTPSPSLPDDFWSAIEALGWPVGLRTGTMAPTGPHRVPEHLQQGHGEPIGLTPLQFAVGHTLPMDPDWITGVWDDRTMYTLMWAAIRDNDVDLMEAMSRTGDGYHRPSYFLQYELLGLLLQQDDPEVVAAMVGPMCRMGANPNAMTKVYSSLHLPALACAQDDRVRTALLEAGADVNIVFDEQRNNRTLLELALSRGHWNPPLARWMVNHGADVNLPGTKGLTPLMVLLNHDHPQEETEEMFWLLMGHGADVQAQSGWGTTALMYAAMRQPSFIIPLLDAGANMDAKDKHGRDFQDHALHGPEDNRAAVRDALRDWAALQQQQILDQKVADAPPAGPRPRL